jgi:LPXTG-motif cell wall-anchored protein
MPSTGTDGLDTLLFAGLAIVLAGIVFVGALEGWRRWSHNRRMKNHFRN